tara:strand:- start:747 stop:1235 length:489 start_codon:yes stop_codon:yes gene_type:complete
MTDVLMGLFIAVMDYKIMKGRQMIIICDLDGTLCNCEHRLQLAEEKRWDEFNEGCIDDLVYEDVANIVRNLKEPEVQIYLVSGRTDNFKKQTEDWLVLNDIPYDRLYMRKEGDHRSDHIVKLEVLMKIKKSDIWFVLEDRTSVVEMWRKQGLTCLQVQKGDF